MENQHIFLAFIAFLEFLMLIALGTIGFFLKKHVEKVENLEKKSERHQNLIDVQAEKISNNREMNDSIMKLHVETINGALVDIRSAIARLESKIDEQKNSRN